MRGGRIALDFTELPRTINSGSKTIIWGAESSPSNRSISFLAADIPTPRRNLTPGRAPEVLLPGEDSQGTPTDNTIMVPLLDQGEIVAAMIDGEATVKTFTQKAARSGFCLPMIITHRSTAVIVKSWAR